MILREIGSEYWDGCTIASDMEFTMRPKPLYLDFRVIETLSGRTALEHVVEILLGEGKCSAYLPSYCCHTMIEPFLRHGMSISFYDVTLSKNGVHREININTSSDIVLLLDYFGFKDAETEELALALKAHGKIVIYDATHMLYSKTNLDSYDYIFGSYRKWIDINCGFLAKKTEFAGGSVMQHDSEGSRFVTLRNDLFHLKCQYINGANVSKGQFLPKISEAETALEQGYHHMLPDNRSLEILRTADAQYIKQKRLHNGNILAEGINALDDDRVSLLYPRMHIEGIPLFIPVVVKHGLRNKLRKFLIDNCIYCPVHWPLSDEHPKNSKSQILFDSELSLVCDQRYDGNDMIRIVDTIKQFLLMN